MGLTAGIATLAGIGAIGTGTYFGKKDKAAAQAQQQQAAATVASAPNVAADQAAAATAGALARVRTRTAVRRPTLLTGPSGIQPSAMVPVTRKSLLGS